MRQTFTYVVSLGFNCRPGFQIRRYFGRTPCIASVFDKQVTPPAALLEYLRRDFRGMFERSDLERRDDHVVNLRYETAHHHEFRTEDIDNDYPAARARHDKFCDNVRRAMSGFSPILFVANADASFATEVSPVIRDINPRLPFHVLTVSDDLTPTRSKEAWKGNDDIWSRSFEPFLITVKPVNVLTAAGARFAEHLLAFKF